MRYLLLLCCAGLLYGQGTETKTKAEDYDVHGQSKSGAVGAEYMVHSYSRGDQMFIAKDYLVVDVAIFPPKGSPFELARTDFYLRINGKKDLLGTVDPRVVLSDMDHPDFKMPRDGGGVDGEGRVGPVGGTVGGTPTNPNPFPGSRPPGSQPYPPVNVPRDNPGGVTKEPVDPARILLETALVEGPHRGYTSGFVYFPFRGKSSSIKSLELIYQDAVLKLK